MRGSRVAVCIAFIGLLLTGCAEPVECSASLTKAQCEYAAEQAREYLRTGLPPGPPEGRLAKVGKACVDFSPSDCLEDFDGYAFVDLAYPWGMYNSAGVLVCIDDTRCRHGARAYFGDL